MSSAELREGACESIVSPRPILDRSHSSAHPRSGRPPVDCLPFLGGRSRVRACLIYPRSVPIRVT